jgi:hypothetical protein
MSTETLLMAGDFARELGVSHARVLQLTESGALPLAAKTPTGWRLYSPASVRAYRARRDAKRARATVGAGRPDEAA